MAKLLCPHCGFDVSLEPLPLSRHAVCQSCYQPLRCCLLCRHYDESHAFLCLEDRADPPIEKANANFCDFFAPQLGRKKTQVGLGSEHAVSALNALFGEEEATSSSVAESTGGATPLDAKLAALFDDATDDS